MKFFHFFFFYLKEFFPPVKFAIWRLRPLTYYRTIWTVEFHRPIIGMVPEVYLLRRIFLIRSLNKAESLRDILFINIQSESRRVTSLFKYFHPVLWFHFLPTLLPTLVTILYEIQDNLLCQVTRCLLREGM